MKKILLFASIALLVLSCTKEEINPVEPEEELVFTASIVSENTTDTKTDIKIEGGVGKVAWVQGDIITVTDANSKEATYSATSSGPTSTFTKVGGEKLTGTTFTAKYGDIDDQNFNAAHPGSNCPMTGAQASEGSTKLNFTNSCAVVKINAKPNCNLKAIMVNGKTLSVGADFTSASNATDFYIAVNPTGADSPIYIKFIRQDDKICLKSSKNKYLLSASRIQPVKFSQALSFNDSPGVFSVSSTKKVKFASGLLYYDGSKKSYANTTDQFEPINDSWVTKQDDSHVMYLFSTTVNTTLYPYSGNNYAAAYACGTFNAYRGYYGNSSLSGGKAVADYDMLTSAEMDYLINAKKDGRQTFTHEVCKKIIDDKAYYGCFLYPDDYTGISGIGDDTEENGVKRTTKAAITQAGIVYLPISGLRKTEWYGSAYRSIAVNCEPTALSTQGSGYYVGYYAVLGNSETQIQEFYMYGWHGGVVKYNECSNYGKSAGIVRLVKVVQ